MVKKFCNAMYLNSTKSIVQVFINNNLNFLHFVLFAALFEK